MKSILSAFLVLSSSSVFALTELEERQSQLDNLQYSTSKIKVEKNEKLNSLLRCVRKTVRNKNANKDTANSMASLLSSVLEDGTLSSDGSKVLRAEEACRNKAYDVVERSDDSSFIKAEAVIEKMINPTFACKSYSGELSAAVLLGVGVGGAVYQCHGTDGSVRLYAGPKFLASVGLGANATVQKRNEWENRENEIDKSSVFPVMVGAELKYGIVLSKVVDMEGKGVGLGVNYDGFATLTSRVGSRRSRWHVLQSFLETK